MLIRPRRNRRSEAVRNMVQENHISVHDLIYPLFIKNTFGEKEEISSMPNIYRWSKDNILKEIDDCINLGIQNFVLFPVVDESLKNSTASYSYSSENFYLEVIANVKKSFPQISLMSDVAMDPYSSDGHDGIVKDGEILNDESVEILKKMSLAQAQAGIDIIGPSDMMDGRVGGIREFLDENSYKNTAIMAYTAKYASAFYGPFRDALDSAPKFGDKKSYQMNPANSKEALVEAKLDVEEGADYLMVKPGLPYLDIIHSLNENFNLPITAYNVSGEYAMIHAASQKGWLDYDKVMVETLLSFKRAGASAVLTYFAKDFAKLKVNDL